MKSGIKQEVAKRRRTIRDIFRNLEVSQGRDAIVQLAPETS